MSKFQVRVISAGSKMVPLVKTLQLVADLGLGEAKSLTDYIRENAPCILVAGVSRDVADHAVNLLREAGADAVVDDCRLVAPMILCPEADHQHRWSWVSTPQPQPVG